MMKITFTELQKIEKHEKQRRQLKRRVSELEGERAVLKQQIAELVAHDAVLSAKAAELFDKSETTEARLRAGLPKT